MRQPGPFLLVLALLTFPAFAGGEDGPPSIRLDLTAIGKGMLTLSQADLASLPQTEAEVTFETSKGEEKGRFAGVPVWEILSRHGLAELKGHNAALSHTFVVTARDGYTMPFSIGEIAPDFGATPMMIATTVDGRPLPDEDAPRLIVPGDARGARNVKAVSEIALH